MKKTLLLALVGALALCSVAGAGPPLIYHGGLVMQTQAVTHVYWQPAGYTYTAGYKELLDRFSTDLAADAGTTSDVFAVTNEYPPFSYQGQSFLGSVIDQSSYPANGCANSRASVCLSLAQVKAHIIAYVNAQGWLEDSDHVYAFLTPQNVAPLGQSTYNGLCGYHSSGVGSRGPVIYVIVPFANWKRQCLANSAPNGDPSADKATSTLMHELAEAATNPNGPAANGGWYWTTATLESEIADDCTGHYGAQIGATLSGSYNQIINGHPYELQGLWSNAIGACAWGG
jgi:hypothetical protein